MDVNDEVISRLKFINKINPGEKISVKGMYIQSDSWVPSIARSVFTHDSRETTMNFLNTAIKKGFDLLKMYHENFSKDASKTFDRTMFNNILSDLCLSKRGLNNLKKTYESDRMFCCKLDTLTQEIDALLAQYGVTDAEVME